MIYDDLINDYLSYETFASGLSRNAPVKIIVHHTGGTDKDSLADSSGQTFEIVDAYHKERWDGKTLSSLGHYIGYQYFIDITGKITQGRKDDDLGAHTIGENARSIGICLAGNFDRTMPSPAQVKALKQLLHDLCAKHPIVKGAIYPHRHFAVKTCYGKNISDHWALDLLDGSVPVSPPVLQERLSIPEFQVTIKSERISQEEKPTFNLFAYLYNLCKKLFRR